MKMKQSGAVEIKGYTCIFSNGEWVISHKGSHVGYMDTLESIPDFLSQNETEIRARLARVQAEAEERKIFRTDLGFSPASREN